jgi:hypothetical protein
MTRTEKFLAELIALPSVNPAFVPPSSVGPRCRAASDDQQVVPTLIFNRTITLRDTWANETQKQL